MFKQILHPFHPSEWLYSLFHPAPPPEAEPLDLAVPEGRLALLIRDGVPQAWLAPGRHALDPADPLEVRLVPVAPGLGAPCLPGQGLDLPYERALLFVEGRHVASIIPGRMPIAASGPCPEAEPTAQDQTARDVLDPEEEPVYALV